MTRDGNTARTQVLADFNRDGRVDWLRAAPPGIEIDFGDGSGGFAQDSYSLTIPDTDSNNNANIIPGDFDDDGDIDLLVMLFAPSNANVRVPKISVPSPAWSPATMELSIDPPSVVRKMPAPFGPLLPVIVLLVISTRAR